MPLLFNDLGDPSNEPCGFTVGNLCGSANYGSWHRTASIIDGQLAVVASAADASVADRVQATSLRTEFLQFPAGSSLGVQFFPSDRTHAIARWAQNAADFLTELTGQGEGLPANLFEPPPSGGGFGSGLFAGISTGAVLGIVGAGAALWYFTSRGKRGR